MFSVMGTSLHTFCGRVQLTLAIGLLVACAANVALVWAFLYSAITREPIDGAGVPTIIVRNQGKPAAERPATRDGDGHDRGAQGAGQ
jgi:hypothetical protein